MTGQQQFGHFEIEEQLGDGGHFEVFRALDPVRRRTVALKVLKSSVFSNRENAVAFLEGAQRAADLVHPHIAWVWETGEMDGAYYLVERFVEGASLAQIIAVSSPLPWLQAQQVVSQIAQGLDFAHRRGWVHGDVTPGEILFSPELGAVLIGFGLNSGLSAAGEVPLPSPKYRAPELWEGGQPNSLSDQYALACVMVEMLTGQPLFEAPTQAEIKTSHFTGLDQLQAWAESLPWQVFPAVKRALSRDPALRYPSAGDFAEAPQRMAAEAGESSEERARQEEEARLWQEAEEQARRQAEEVARQAAVEQARREMQEQLLQEASPGEIDDRLVQPQDVNGSMPSLADIPRRESVPRRRTAPQIRNWRWLVWAVLFILALVIGGLFLRSVLARGGLLSATATPSPTALMISTSTATNTPLLTPSQMPTITFTTTATQSSTPMPTSTRTPTVTSSPTITGTHTRTPTPTRTPDDRPELENPGRNLPIITP